MYWRDPKIWVRKSPGANIEVRDVPMSGAEMVEISMADVLQRILNRLMPVKVRIEGWGRLGGTWREFCFEGDVGVLGALIDLHLKLRKPTRIMYDGVVGKPTNIPLSTVIVTITSNRRPGLRITLKLARNWLIDEWRNRFGKDNAIYVEYDDDTVLDKIFDDIVNGSPEYKVRGATVVPYKIYQKKYKRNRRRNEQVKEVSYAAISQDELPDVVAHFWGINDIEIPNELIYPSRRWWFNRDIASVVKVGDIVYEEVEKRGKKIKVPCCVVVPGDLTVFEMCNI